MTWNVEPTVLAGRRVLFVMAAEAEYGPALRTRFAPLMTGVGPVEAALALGAVLASKPRPDLVVSLGSAGSRHLQQAEVYQVSAVAYRDMDASAFGFAKGCTPFLDQPALIPLPHRIAGLPQATLSSGGAVISGAAYSVIAQDMVDMETFAVLRACQRFDVPLIGLRGISDGVADVTGLADWTEYLHVIDQKLALAVDTLAAALSEGSVEV
jgi:adenosylhomocysteine nucleosidase